MAERRAVPAPAGLPAGAVDCHAHVMRVDAPLVRQRHSAPARDVTAEEYLALLDAHGVRCGVLTAPSFYGTDNGLLLQALGHAPDRLRGTAIVDPGIGDAELDALRAQGVVGVRLNWIRRAALPDPAGADYRALYARLRERDMHIELYLESAHQAQVLPPILDSGVRLVLDHLGSPDPAQGPHGAAFGRVLAALQSGRVWVKLSAPYRLARADAAPYARALLRAGRPQRLVWATDWPWVGYENAVTYRQCIDWLFQWVPDDAQRQAILVDTPRKLFHFPGA